MILLVEDEHQVKKAIVKHTLYNEEIRVLILHLSNPLEEVSYAYYLQDSPPTIQKSQEW